MGTTHNEMVNKKSEKIDKKLIIRQFLWGYLLSRKLGYDYHQNSCIWMELFTFIMLNSQQQYSDEPRVSMDTDITV